MKLQEQRSAHEDKSFCCQSCDPHPQQAAHVLLLPSNRNRNRKRDRRRLDAARGDPQKTAALGTVSCLCLLVVRCPKYPSIYVTCLKQHNVCTYCNDSTGAISIKQTSTQIFHLKCWTSFNFTTNMLRCVHGLLQHQLYAVEHLVFHLCICINSSELLLRSLISRFRVSPICSKTEL